ncbi:hypothetical protein V6669_20270 [Paenibacillus sp. Y5S-9]|uniref:hypothetical protein n=1 Tax=Paenibacillus sp. Y5S-9 TaxID=3122489 RepID=UPI0030CCCAA6
MNFRKLLTPLLTVGLIFSSASSAFAQEKPDYDTDRYTIVKEYDQNNSTPFFNAQSVDESIPEIDLEVSEGYDVDLLENTTRPLYDLRDKETGEIVTQYATDVSILAAGQRSDNQEYKEFNIKVYGTIYYILTGKNSLYVTIDKVSFRWENNGRTPGTKDHSVYVDQFGATEGGAKVNQNKTVTYGLVSHGTVLVRDWNWTPVFTSPEASSVAVKFNATEVDAIGGTHPLSFVIRLY